MQFDQRLKRMAKALAALEAKLYFYSSGISAGHEVRARNRSGSAMAMCAADVTCASGAVLDAAESSYSWETRRGSRR